MVTPAPVPSNVSRSQATPTSNASVSSNASASNSGTGGVHVKTEPGSNYDLHNLPQAQNSGVYNNHNQAALQRAQQQLHEKFGDSASVQVNQLQARANLASQGGQQQRALPNQQSLSDEQRRQLSDQQRKMFIQQRQQYHQRATVNNTQTDGAAEWDAMVAQRRAEALESDGPRIEADLSLRQQVEQMSHDMEGGGLMMPLSEYSQKPVSKKRKVLPNIAILTNGPSELLAAESDCVSRPPQFDGTDDTDDDDKAGIKDDPDIDEDAINSDLDDPDDNVVDETEEDGQQGQIMLCVYDKVQRVKNKWKCTLKDGVLTTGGKE